MPNDNDDDFTCLTLTSIWDAVAILIKAKSCRGQAAHTDQVQVAFTCVHHATSLRNTITQRCSFAGRTLALEALSGVGWSVARGNRDVEGGEYQERLVRRENEHADVSWATWATASKSLGEATYS